jgi:hypothetical protein
MCISNFVLTRAVFFAAMAFAVPVAVAGEQMRYASFLAWVEQIVEPLLTNYFW